MTIAYATLADVKSWLRIDAANTSEDALLTRMVAFATAWIQTYLSREVLSSTHTETHDGVGGWRQCVRHLPVTAVASVTIDDGIVEPIRYRFDEFGVAMKSSSFPRGFGNVVVTYTGGYAVVPDDIVQCTIDIVAFNYRRRERIGHASKAMAGEVTAFITSDIPPECRQVLAQYRRVGMV